MLKTEFSRREMLAIVGTLPALAGAAPAAAQPANSQRALPDRANFAFEGIYLDAAFTHPLSGVAFAAGSDYLSLRKRDPQGVSPRRNARASAVERFARLINAAPADIAIVPSTMEGENLINASLGIGPGAGVVTDGLHYDASLALYGELQRRGAPLAIVRPRPESLQRLKRVEVGWRQVRSQHSHVPPLEPPGPVLGSYELAADAAGLFEVSTPAWGPLATVAASLGYIEALGVDTIARYRQPLLDRIQAELPQHGFEALTPLGSRSPIVAYARKYASKQFTARLQAEHIQISVYENRIRISPSVYNTMDDVEHLLMVLSA